MVLSKSLQVLAGLCGYRYRKGSQRVLASLDRSLKVSTSLDLTSQKVSAGLGGYWGVLAGLGGS